MTTKVTVGASDWDVRVTFRHPKTKKNIQRSKVFKHTEQTFYIHSDQDVLVHEIGPRKPRAKNKPKPE